MEDPSSIKRHFHEKGYVVLNGALSNHESIKQKLDLLLAEHEGNSQEDWNRPGIVKFPSGSAMDGKIQKVQGVGIFAPWVLNVFQNSAVIQAISSLTVDDLDIFGTKFFPMCPGGTSVNWHQDNHFFGTASSKIISAAIYLERADKENGALRVIPGSHLTGQVDHAPGTDEWANGEWATVDESQAVDVNCDAGTVVLFNALLLHAAHKNVSKNRTRFSIFGHFVPRGLDFSWRGVDFSSGKYEDRHRISKT
ncbi:hypothetical protein CYMTET_8170 [Cymbomonas tetramitiformis]|uniref:Phytanoyl-CoA dioxygenase n=1 Tax=Cymbomonas tetramitiformis TaxID=36881 RepID=A0AAE0LGR6_9CHLO|nr:hypothetical protein CYMTET_8170 [Cymbomonas tetramitiformis]|eukprot:gene13344-15769_t